MVVGGVNQCIGSGLWIMIIPLFFYYGKTKLKLSAPKEVEVVAVQSNP